jgi:translocation and assembly module TamA
MHMLLTAPARAAGPPLQIEVQGVEGGLLANVREALALPPGLVEDGVVNFRWLERFKRQTPSKVQKALEPFGYYSATVKAEIESVAENNYVLRITIVPGEPVVVSRAKVSVRGPGAEEKPLRELAASFPLKEGEVLNTPVYEKAKGAMKARAMELGYLDADFSVHKILVWKAESKAQVELELDTGPRYFFGEVGIEGAPQYPRPFLHRYLAFKTGDVFSYAKLGETQLNLVNSDRFKDIVISPEKEETENHMVPVTLKLETKPPKRLRAGAGYGTDTGARFSVNYKDLNLFDRGRELDASLSISQRLQGLAADYTVPGRSAESSKGLQLNLRREDVTTYVSKLASLEARVTRGFGRGWMGTAYLRVQKENSVIGVEKVNARLVLPGVRFSQRRYDDLVRPRKGHHYNFELRGTDHLLGSNVGFLQFLADGKILVPLPFRLSLISRVTGAFTFQRGAMLSLPASLRFFAGGDNSVRGYSYQSLGPEDSAGNIVGGKNIFVGSIEVERAILQDWGVAGFYDVGNAFNVIHDITLFQGAGVGVRYYTKVGAVRIDIARQIGVENPHFKIHFNFGFQL